MKAMVRTLLISAIFVFGLAAAASAQSYPSRVITIIVPFTPGGAVDFVGRTYAAALQERLGQPVVVVNKPGAGGAIGARTVATADPDGYTLLLGSIGPMTIYPSLKMDLPFDVARDFEPVVLIAKTPAILVVHPKSSIHNIQNFNDWVRNKPNELNFGSAGIGNITHVVAEYYMSIAKLKANHVPYKGSAEADTDMLGGRLDFMFDVIPSAQPFVQSGQFRAIAVTTKTRSTALPNVPTLDELGFKGFDVSSWFGIFAPVRTPPEIVAKLNAVVNMGLNSGSGLDKLHSVGAEFGGGSSSDFKDFVVGETARWKKVIDDAGIRIE